MDTNQHIPSGYKPSPLGIIPEDWGVKRLGEIFTFKNGVNASKESYGEGVKFVNTMDVLNNTFIDSHVIRGKVKVNDKIKEEFIVSCGDVLFNRTSETREEVGCSAVYNDSEEAVFGGFIIRAHDIKSNTLDLLYKGYCFQPPYIRNQISALGNGAIRYNLGQEDLSRVKLLIPPLPEQQRIVSVLSLWDTAIAKQTALIEQLTLRKRGLMQQLLTGKKRLKGFEGEWKEVRMQDLASFAGGGTPSTKRSDFWEGTIPWISSSDLVEDCLTNNESRYITEEAIANSTTQLLPSKSILIVTRVGVGKVAIAEHPICVSQDFTCLTKYDADTLFLAYSLLLTMKKKKSQSQGTSIKGVSTDEISKIKLLLPSIEEQKAIASVLINADKEIEIQKQKLAAMQEQKKGLMQVLLTGKRRTK